jgi:hypothetical protein
MIECVATLMWHVPRLYYTFWPSLTQLAGRSCLMGMQFDPFSLRIVWCPRDAKREVPRNAPYLFLLNEQRSSYAIVAGGVCLPEGAIGWQSTGQSANANEP